MLSTRTKNILKKGLADRRAGAEIGAYIDAMAEVCLDIPLTTFVDPDGDPLVKFVDGASAVPGWNLADSEAFGIRWNNNATFNEVLTSIAVPKDLDNAYPAYLEAMVSKTGATLADATIVTFTCFIVASGALHDSDANCGGDTNAVTGNAAAKTTSTCTRTIAAADIPTGAVRTMYLTMKPKNGTLGTDDFIVHSLRLRYTAKTA